MFGEVNLDCGGDPESENRSRSTGPSPTSPEQVSPREVTAGTIRPPAFVKIDVEGAELDVIEGMRRTIAAHRRRN